MIATKIKAKSMQQIAILGKPNVGKSSLFNRLAKQRIAITSQQKGTTRDFNRAHILISGNEVEIIDTGGIDTESKNDEIFSQVKKHSILIGKDADLVLYLVDGSEIPSDEDKNLIYEISKYTPCFLVVNKIDSDAKKEFAYGFSAFGIKDLFFISVVHNRGISILLNAIHTKLFTHTDAQDSQDMLESLEETLKLLESSTQKSALESRVASDSNVIRVGIIGRVNVGKSSLLNVLVGKERSIVSSIAGTTIDPVDEMISIGDMTLQFVDTAGIRRRGKIEGIEKYALERTSKALELADIALLVLDSSEPFVELDEKIFSLVQKHNLAVIIVLNKWDIKRADFEVIQKELLHKFRFLEYAPFITLSTKNKRHIKELQQKILEVYANYSFRIPTAKLNESIAAAQRLHSVPSDHGKIVKIYYATQFDSKPPQIALICNRPKSLHFSYKRFLINQLRKEFNLFGTPILVFPRQKGESKNEVDNKEN